MSDSDRRTRNSNKPLINDTQLRGMVAASNLTPTQRSTLLAMADGLYRNDLTIRLAIQRLADALGISRRATFDRVRSLESSGVIRLIHGGGGRSESGRGITNLWKLDVNELRQQALDREAATLGLTRPTHHLNGARDCTQKGEAEQRQGCREPTSRVQLAAHDPISPIPPREESKKENPTNEACIQSKKSRMDIRQRKWRPDGLRPWVNRFDGPRQSRADRLTQMRMQLAQCEKISRQKPANQVDSTTEGEH